MKRIRVLQFPVANSKGGITQYVLQNWKFIDKSKFHFDFATMSKSLDFADALEKEGCKIHYISCYAEEDKKKFIHEFKRVLMEGNYDVVHLHTKQWKSFLVEQIAKEVGVKKIIVHAHNTGIDTLDERKREEEIQLHDQCLQKLTEATATDFWACSWRAADFLFGNKIPKQKIRIMKNAIELQKYVYNPQTREKYRKHFGIADGECVIGNVGRFAYAKNQEFLIKVFAEMCGSGEVNKQKNKLLLVGSGEREQEYKRIVHENNLDDNVIFMGYRTDVSEVLQAMDIFCLPSRMEGLGIALVEAQASGLPCIISDNVPKDGIINGNVFQLSLNAALWKEKILECEREKYRRENSKIDLIDGGYDINMQIKNIEHGYEM